MEILLYRIRPNYRTVYLGFSKLQEKLMVKYISTYTKGILKKDQERSYLMMLVRCLCGVYLIFFIKAYVVDTHLNCIDKSMQFK